MNHATFDGLIYVLIALFGATGAALGTDDAAKYIEPATLWYAKSICNAIAASLLALKMFRSTTYSDARDAINGVSKVQTSPPIVPPETSAGATVAKVGGVTILIGIGTLLFYGLKH
jgi:hypothetical protein